jgi:magnesium transporter
MPVLHALLRRAGDGFEDTIDPDAISNLITVAGNILWLDIQDPTPDDVELLRCEFGFHELALEDVVAPHERAKIDRYDGYYFIVFNAFEDHKVREIDLFVSQHYLISVHHGPVAAIAETIDRWRRNAVLIGPEVGGLLYTLLDAVVDGYFPVVDALAERVETLETTIFQARGSDRLADVFALKKELLNLRRVLSPERDVLNVLLRRDVPHFDAEVLLYFQDVYDHTIRVLDSIDLYRDQLTGLLDAYLSIVSNRLNATMKRMTALATILMSLALVSGIYGMNFQLTPSQDWAGGFWWAMGLMLAIGVGLTALFVRLDWL